MCGKRRRCTRKCRKNGLSFVGADRQDVSVAAENLSDRFVGSVSFTKMDLYPVTLHHRVNRWIGKEAQNLKTSNVSIIFGSSNDVGNDELRSNLL